MEDNTLQIFPSAGLAHEWFREKWGSWSFYFFALLSQKNGRDDTQKTERKVEDEIWEFLKHKVGLKDSKTRPWEVLRKAEKIIWQRVFVMAAEVPYTRDCWENES